MLHVGKSRSPSTPPQDSRTPASTGPPLGSRSWSFHRSALHRRRPCLPPTEAHCHPTQPRLPAATAVSDWHFELLALPSALRPASRQTFRLADLLVPASLSQHPRPRGSHPAPNLYHLTLNPGTYSCFQPRTQPLASALDTNWSLRRATQKRLGCTSNSTHPRRGLSTCDSRALEHRLKSCGAQAYLRGDGGVSGVSSSCGARGGFLPRHDEDLREPLVRRQGSHVSIRAARGSASWLSSHGRGLGPRDALKKVSSFHLWGVMTITASPGFYGN